MTYKIEGGIKFQKGKPLPDKIMEHIEHRKESLFNKIFGIGSKKSEPKKEVSKLIETVEVILPDFYSAEELADKFLVKDLKEMAKANGFKGYSKLKEEELCVLLEGLINKD